MCFCCRSASIDLVSQNHQAPLSRTAISGPAFSFRSVTALSQDPVAETSSNRVVISRGNSDRNIPSPSLRSVDIVIAIQKRESAIRDFIKRTGLLPNNEIV